MSDVSGGQGWWQASDGKWYPPEQHPHYQQPQQKQLPPGAWKPQQHLVAGLQKPKKGLSGVKILGIIVGGFVILCLGLGIIGAISDPEGMKQSFKDGVEEGTKAASTSDETTTTTEKPKEPEKTTTTKPGPLFPGRIDVQKEDQERVIGDSAKLSGYTATVTDAMFRQSFDTYSKAGYITVRATVENRDDRAQPYSPGDWKIQLPSGQVLDHTYESEAGKEIGSGDLVKDGKAEGVIVFETGSTKGDYFIIYKPDPWDAARGIWKVTV